jgi:hypothetical protein
MKKACLILALLIGGCTYQKFQLEDRLATVPSKEGTNHFIFWGLGQTKTVDPREVCGSKGVSAVETRYTFINGLLSGITYGIYSPRNYVIYCKPGK